MKYFSETAIKQSFDAIKGNLDNKFFGILAILKQVGSVKSNHSYCISSSNLSIWLDEILYLSTDNRRNTTEEKRYVKFSYYWQDYIKSEIIKSTVNVFDLIIFLYKQKSFSEETSFNNLLTMFCNEFSLSNEILQLWFDCKEKEITYSNMQTSKPKIKSLFGITNDTISMSSPYSVLKRAGDLSGAPFIQTLYAGGNIAKCLIINNFNFEEYYSEQATKDLNKPSTTIQKIYYGSPGCGKSHYIKKDLEDKKVKEENVFRTTFHPDTDYASFVGAYKPSMENEVIKYKFVPQVFTKAYIKAWNNPSVDCYLIIEEINRGNCAQIFGDIFQLLDRKNGESVYPISADSDLSQYVDENLKDEGRKGIENNKLKLPSNLHIIATMNTSDQSLFPMDSAFKRRWEWEYMPIKYTSNSNFKIEITDNENNLYTFSWHSFLEKINPLIDIATGSEDKQLGNYFITANINSTDFISKVMFFLWFEVCKEERHTPRNFFRISEEEEFTFNELFKNNGNDILIQFMKYHNVEDYTEKFNETII